MAVGSTGGAGQCGPPGSGLAAPPLQKIMHTRKRHQDMFQDLNRKLQHTEKDKEVLGPDSKVRRAQAGGGWGRGALGSGGFLPSSSNPASLTRSLSLSQGPAWPAGTGHAEGCVPGAFPPSHS